MNVENVIYYAGIIPGRSKPTTVFRFFNDQNKMAERYVVRRGWIEDKDVMLMKMKGDITENTRISPEEAKNITNNIENFNA
ncbi:hypothetical protein ORJ00_11325 [Rheinheimera baltica]|uniref:hypothetical protein n=1 Tax=Rheinheimera baltica TaxID=67576 RepID=UPI00273FB80A|nr:hypothetical protein [Rheinheimera baltica]MDP5143337.1 hypothetical protein [Rheinheimera baltica]